MRHHMIQQRHLHPLNAAEVAVMLQKDQQVGDVDPDARRAGLGVARRALAGGALGVDLALRL